jgi:hypothetical protein
LAEVAESTQLAELAQPKPLTQLKSSATSKPSVPPRPSAPPGGSAQAEPSMIEHHAPGGLMLPPPPKLIAPTVCNSPSKEAQGSILLEAKATIQSISKNNSQLRERFRIL